jgi:hypothetical protein
MLPVSAFRTEVCSRIISIGLAESLFVSSTCKPISAQDGIIGLLTELPPLSHSTCGFLLLLPGLKVVFIQLCWTGFGDIVASLRRGLISRLMIHSACMATCTLFTVSRAYAMFPSSPLHLQLRHKDSSNSQTPPLPNRHRASPQTPKCRLPHLRMEC